MTSVLHGYFIQTKGRTGCNVSDFLIILFWRIKLFGKVLSVHRFLSSFCLKRMIKIVYNLV